MPWLSATAHSGPHWAVSLGLVTGEGRLLDFRFCGYNSTTFCFKKLGFSLERNM